MLLIHHPGGLRSDTPSCSRNGALYNAIFLTLTFFTYDMPKVGHYSIRERVPGATNVVVVVVVVVLVVLVVLVGVDVGVIIRFAIC